MTDEPAPVAEPDPAGTPDPARNPDPAGELDPTTAPDPVSRRLDAPPARVTLPDGELRPADAVPLPSVGARLVGFVSILVAGAAGGFIGYAVTDLQCTGDCTTAKGIGGLVGAVIVAVGVAIVVQLALRAMSEWRTIQERGGPEAERQRQRAVERRLPPETRPRPRVR